MVKESAPIKVTIDRNLQYNYVVDANAVAEAIVDRARFIAHIRRTYAATLSATINEARSTEMPIAGE